MSTADRQLANTAYAMPRLTEYERGRVERARQALAASQADTDVANYPRHLDALEVDLADMITLIEQLSNV